MIASINAAGCCLLLPRLLMLMLASAIILMAIPSSSFSNFHLLQNQNNNNLNINNDIQKQRGIIPLFDRSSQMIVRMTSSPSTTQQQQQQQNREQEQLKLATKFSSLRSLGVDYGLTRTGIAITTGGYQPRPLTILSKVDNDSTQQLASTIVKYVQSERAANVVLGLPLHKNGTASEQSAITRQFAQCLLREIRSRCGARVALTLWDERYTSKEAAARIAAEAMSRNERIPSASDLHAELDADAACIILEDYYKELGEDAEVVELEDEEAERECEEAYGRNLEREEKVRVGRMEERERGRNARRDMMERDKALEEQQRQNGDDGNTKKKKKKKKKKK